VDQLTEIIKNRLKAIQYRAALIGDFLAQTALSLEPGGCSDGAPAAGPRGTPVGLATSRVREIVSPVG
jgi:hypothetical protein